MQKERLAGNNKMNERNRIEYKKDFLKKNGYGRRFLVFCLTGCLLLLSGCTQKEANTGKLTEGAKKEDMQGTVQREENSLAKWEADLQGGKAEEISAPAIRGLCVTLEGEPYFAVSYEPREYKNSFDCWAISVPYESMVSVDTEVMYDYFQMVADLELGSTENISRQQAGIEEESPRIFVAYYEGQTDTGGQAQPDKGITFHFGKEDGKGNYYVEAAGEIRTADKNAVEKLLALNPYDFVLKVVSVVSVETVSKVEIEADGKKYVMKAEKEEFTFDKKKVDSNAFYGLYTELMSIFIEKELPEEERGEDTGEALFTVIYHRNREDAPQIVQEYYAYDKEYALARVNGTEFFLVDRDAIEELKGKIEDAFY